MGKIGKTALLIALLGFLLASQASEQPGGCREQSGGDERVTHREDHDSVHFDNQNYPSLVINHSMLDITDALLRLHGEDPYRLVKARILDETRDERAGMALRVRTEHLRESVVQMPAYLEKIWDHTPWPTAERRMALFTLWQEVAEEGDAELVSTGSMVRATIIAFIRKRLPEGSAEAYDLRELEALNQQRTCKARFEPYTVDRSVSGH